MRKLLSPRNLAIILITLVVVLGSAVVLRVPLPTISLRAEKVFSLGGFGVTNTLIATLLADVTIIVLAFAATRRMSDVPEGLQNLVEWFIEAFYNLTEEVAGKANARRWFPMFMTILIFLLVANWWELVPGFDSIGKIEPIEVAYEEAGVRKGFELGSFLGIKTLVARPVSLTEEQIQEIEQDAAAGEQEARAEGVHHVSKYGGYVLVPFLRVAATDLNVPLALALISVFWTQVVGVQYLGGSYFRKFALPSITGMKPIDAFVGVLELISEFAKIISFSFRLFGNIFAGQIILFVIPFLIPLAAVLPFYGLELFVGFMQAFVFAILTLIFMTMAVVSHAGEHH